MTHSSLRAATIITVAVVAVNVVFLFWTTLRQGQRDRRRNMVVENIHRAEEGTPNAPPGGSSIPATTVLENESQQEEIQAILNGNPLWPELRRVVPRSLLPQ